MTARPRTRPGRQQRQRADDVALDLLGEPVQAPRQRDRREAAALVEVLRAVRAHRAVAWAQRMNSGAALIGKRFVRFGWPGCPDVLGQLRDGRLLGIEVKGPRGRLRAEQAIFLDQVRAAGGVGFVARDVRDVLRELGALDEAGAYTGVAAAGDAKYTARQASSIQRRKS